MKNLCALAIVASVFVVAGCGKKEEVVVSTPDGKVTSTTNADGSQNVTLESDKGTVEMSGKDGEVKMTATDESGKTSTYTAGSAVDPAELGVSLYPGAEPTDGAKDAKVEAGGQTTVMVSRMTSDGPEKVAEFYKKEIREAQAYTSGDSGFVSGKTKDGHSVTVSAMKDKDTGKTLITVSVSKKAK